MPDSAKVRHILIQTNNPQAQQQMLPDSIAKQRIDSIAQAITTVLRSIRWPAVFPTTKAAPKKVVCMIISHRARW